MAVPSTSRENGISLEKRMAAMVEECMVLMAEEIADLKRRVFDIKYRMSNGQRESRMGIYSTYAVGYSYT